jgi:hypothetical protein
MWRLFQKGTNSLVELAECLSAAAGVAMELSLGVLEMTTMLDLS